MARTLPKILYAAYRFFPPRGGAELCTRTLLEELSSDYKCFAVADGNGESIQLGQITFVTVKRVWQMRERIIRINPDIIITHGTFAPFVTAVAKYIRKPVILFVRDHDYFCPDSVLMLHCDKNCKKCILHKSKNSYFQDMEKMFHRVNELIYVSHFMRKIGLDFYGVDGSVVYPFIRSTDVVCRKKKRGLSNIGLSTGACHKGIEIFAQIAQAMPKQRFLVAGRCDNHMPRGLPNMKYIGLVLPTVFYARLSILLVPSIWPEPAARVILEAMGNRIPVVASNIGGIPEIMGTAGILINDYRNPQAWIDKVKLLLGREQLYQHFVEKGFKRFRHYNLTKEVDKVRCLIKKLLC